MSFDIFFTLSTITIALITLFHTCHELQWFFPHILYTIYYNILLFQFYWQSDSLRTIVMDTITRKNTFWNTKISSRSSNMIFFIRSKDNKARITVGTNSSVFITEMLILSKSSSVSQLYINDQSWTDFPMLWSSSSVNLPS